MLVAGLAYAVLSVKKKRGGGSLRCLINVLPESLGIVFIRCPDDSLLRRS